MGRTLADGYIELRAETSKLTADLAKVDGKLKALSAQQGRGSGKAFGQNYSKSAKTSMLGGIKDAVSSVGSLLIPIGIGGAVAAIGKIGMAYEDNLNIFQAVTKATGGQMDQISAKARALGADVKLPGVSAAGAAAAMTELAKAGFGVSQAMDAAQGTLQLARAAGIDEAQAAEIAANAVNAFGVSAKDTNFVVDELAAAAASSSIGVTDASDAFKMAAAVFSGFQGDAVGGKEAITELNTAVAILGNNGIKGSDAGTSLKQALLQLTAPSQKAAGLMADVNAQAAGVNVTMKQQTDLLHGNTKAQGTVLLALDKSTRAMGEQGSLAYDAAGKMRPLRDIIGRLTEGTKGWTQADRDYTISQIFGADATRSILSLMKGGLPVYDKQRTAVMQQGAAADLAAAKNKGLGGALDNVKSQFENAAISVYAVVKGPLTKSLNGLAESLPAAFGRAGSAISATVNLVRDNQGVFTSLAATVGALIVVTRTYGAVTTVQAAGGLAKWIFQTRIAMAVTRTWTAVQWAAQAPMLAYNAVVGISTSTIGTWVGVKYLEAAAWVRSTASTIAATVAAGANRAAMAITTAITGGFVAVKNLEILSWVRATAANLASTAAMVGTRVAMAAVRVATLAWTGVQWLLNAALTANPVGLVVVAIGALVAIVILAYKKNETFRNIVNAVWASIKVAISTVVDWWTKTAWPAIKRGIDFLIPLFQRWLALQRSVWAAVWTAISTTWAFIRDRVFSPLARFITQTIPNAFDTGVNAIRRFWAKLGEYARKPVAFVVNTIINKGIVGNFNKIAGKLGLPDSARLPAVAFAAGGHYSGRLPGTPSSVDNMLGRGPGGQPVALAGGEYIVNARQTAKHLPLLQQLNAGRLAGYASGGLFGALANPAKWLGSKIAGPLGQLGSQFGSSPLVSMLVAFGRKITAAAAAKLKSSFGFGFGAGSGPAGPWPSSPGAQRGDSGVWRSVVRLIKSTGPLSGAFGNAYRPGDPLWHGSGRAVDWMGFNQDALASFLAARRPLELIHRTGRRDYAYTRGRNQGSFDNALMNEHRNHIHIAMANGGRIPTFDNGGVLGTGLNLVNNGTGGPEPLTRGAKEIHLHLHNHGVIGSKREAENFIMAALSSLSEQRRLSAVLP